MINTSYARVKSRKNSPKATSVGGNGGSSSSANGGAAGSATVSIGTATTAYTNTLSNYLTVSLDDVQAGNGGGGVVGGAAGNIADRLQHEFVVDFIDFKTIWPNVFNVADSFITIGVFLLIIASVRREERHS